MFKRKPKPELPDWIKVFRRPTEYIGEKVHYSYRILVEESHAAAITALSADIRVNMYENPGKTTVWGYRDMKFTDVQATPVGWKRVAIGDHARREYEVEFSHGENVAWGIVKAYNGIKNIQLGWERL